MSTSMFRRSRAPRHRAPGPACSPLRRAAQLFSVAAVLAGAGLPVASTAAAAPTLPSPSSPSAPSMEAQAQAGHGYRHGTVPTTQQHDLQAWQAATAPPAVMSPWNLIYRGGVDGIGVTTGPPRVYLVFLGSQWGAAGTDPDGYTTFSGDPAGMAVRLQQLFSGLGTDGELWSGVMTQYCEGVATLAQGCPADAPHVGYPADGALAGIWADLDAPAPDRATGADLAAAAVRAARALDNLTPEDNRDAQYLVVSPPGTSPDGFNTPDGPFCAWHDWNGDPGLPGGPVDSGGIGDIAFTNLPYVPDAAESCGANFVNPDAAGLLDGVTLVAGHEYAETITDQNPVGGWTDRFGSENADKCAWLRSGEGATANVTFSTGTFPMTGTWSNDDAGCRLEHPVVETVVPIPDPVPVPDPIPDPVPVPDPVTDPVPVPDPSPSTSRTGPAARTIGLAGGPGLSRTGRPMPG